MAKKRVNTKTRVLKRRAQNAFELANKEFESDNDSETGYDSKHSRARANGAIVNVKHGSDDEDEDASFQDEELDSDEAFGSDDDFDVLNSKFSQTIRDKKKAGKYVPEEYDEDGGYTSIEEEDLLPLSAVWDANAKVENDDSSSDEVDNDKMQLYDGSSSSESESSEDLSDSSVQEEEEDPFTGISDDEVELTTVTKGLKSTTEKQYKRLDTYAGGVENEFAVPAGSSNHKLDLNAMLGAVDDQEAVDKAILLKGDAKTVAVPLPQRIQKRHERKAAYELSKNEMDKWQDTVQQNRQAEHLSFPINAPVKHNEASAITRSSDKPLTETEVKVQELLKTSNLVDPVKESTFEEIATATLTPEEMKKRTAELRLMRELMFREEIKAKRIKKIKSKAYRRIKKKELMRNKALVESDESDTEHDIARARERMTLKHTNQSKWAKDMIKHGITKDKSTRDEMEESLRQGELLRAKIMGDDNSDDVGSSISDLEDEGPGNQEEEELKRASVGKTGVLNMAFMKNAEARQREANREMVDQLRAAESEQNIRLFEDDFGTAKANVQLNQGRRVYTAEALQSHSENRELNEVIQKEQQEEESSNLQNRLSKDHDKKKSQKSKPAKQPGAEKSSAKSAGKADKQESNPWLDGSDSEEYVLKSSKVNLIDENSSKDAKKANKIEKDKAKNTKPKSAKNGADELLLDMQETNRLNIRDTNVDGSDDESIFTFKQQDVINEAFAGDDVVAKFEEEKKRVAIDEDDKEVDTTLPGWGDWAGAGAQPKKKRKFVKKIKGVVEKDKRRDKNLKNVIINEKVNKKNMKYQSTAVPFPFESKEQYERSLRMPLGQEWTSRKSHQDMIKPRIMVKPGEVIDPLKAPFK
ncbi:HER213Wp [Eremothecium sinecaudum]|uniref:HER213Wp n=1 Tax=Eremothecium sinecaudum TaxID=45286 RepID=A0A0X8HTF2_9SACH|nr:HER213Wp [Eremothecium sinecaudum]AMD21491.1 HER213Wp [Eremothecium sinecaudum]